MAIQQYIIDLQLKIVGDKTILNFSDYVHGNDISAVVFNGKLYQNGQEISLQEFIDKVINEVKTY